MQLRIDLHTHTSRYSPCAKMPPEALCEAALERGLNALVLTEHHHQWSSAEIAALQARYPALKLYAGVEITCTDRHDYVCLGLEEGHYTPHPMSYENLQALVHAHPGAFVFLAHGFRYSTDDSGLSERQIDGVELGSYNILARPQPSSGPAAIVHAELYQAWQHKMGWTALYNSDAHTTWMVGIFYNLVETGDGLPPDERALIRLLRRAEIRPFRDDELIRTVIHDR